MEFSRIKLYFSNAESEADDFSGAIKMKKLSLLMAIAFLLNACSFSNSNKEEITSRPSDELEFAVDTLDETTPSDIVVEEQKIVQEKSPDEMPGSMPEQIVEMKPEEPKFQDFQSAPIIPKISEETAPETHQLSLGVEEKYHVQKGDTLMMIAFKIYGDYRKWRDLKEWNKDRLVTKMGHGVVLKYYVPEQAFGWQPSGLPYMVKTGDNLGMISMQKYGTSKKWKNIYENNRPLIRDPNLIFAGFTLYYMPLRDVASENR